MRQVRNLFYRSGIIALFLLCLGLEPVSAGGTWTPVATMAPAQVQTMLLLSDGTVMALDANTWNLWYKLTPDSHGSYINGTWSTLAPMHYTRLYCASDVLPDGRVFVAGGEYGTGTTNAEVYDPQSNVWTVIPIPSGLINTNNTSVIGTENDAGFMDAYSVVLSNGKVLICPVVPAHSGLTTIYDPVANSWSTANLVNDFNEDESTGILLPDNSILLVDSPVNGPTMTTERYIPSQNQWINDAVIPVALFDPYGFEEGAAFLLPNGKAFFMGSTPVTAIYTPSGSTSPGTWAAGHPCPTIPASLTRPRP